MMVTGGWDVVLVAGARFGGHPPLGDWQLARALAEFRRVLYVDPPRAVHRRASWSPADRFVERVTDRRNELAVLRPRALPGFNRPTVSGPSNRLIERQVEAVARRLLAPAPVLITFDPKRGSFDHGSWRGRVYWLRDRLTHSRNTAYPDHVGRLHRDLLRQADLVTAVSATLVSEVQGRVRRSAVVHNGCDFAAFSRPTAPPRELEELPRPRIGFVGGVSWRVDTDLLAAVARQRPDWSICLVGEVERRPPPAENLVLLGHRPYEQLPALVQGFDVGIVPYRRDVFNDASFPLKVFEYLAAGIPVVTTCLPELAGLEPHVRRADDPHGFVLAVERALAEGPGPDACRALARAHSWAARARQLEELVGEVLARA